MSTNGPVLHGLTALVADGGRGLGREVALNLGACGARVAIVSGSRARADRTSRAVEEEGGLAWPFPADTTDPAAVPELISKVGRRLGSADILVSCASAAGPQRPAATAGTAELARALTTDAAVMLAMTSAVLPVMLDRGWGRIVTVRGESPARPAPAASDQVAGVPAAAEQILAALAAGLAGTGVTVNGCRHGDSRAPRRRTA